MPRHCPTSTVTSESTQQQLPQKRRYSGPPKGSKEACDRMAKVRAAQWAKNGLVQNSDAR